jgi:hypothetical protein
MSVQDFLEKNGLRSTVINEKVNEDGSESFQLEKGLDDKAAKAAASKFKLKKDHRGFHYNPKTGIAVYT